MSCGTIVASRYTLPTSLVKADSINNAKGVLHRAVALTVLEHPLLQVGLVNEDSSRPDWVELKSIDLDWHVKWESVGSSEDYDARLNQAISRQLDTWFTDLDTRPGWRISVLHHQEDARSLDVVFSWNHASLDGVGGKMFQQALLRNLNDPRVNEEMATLKKSVLELPSVADKFPPPPESVRSFPLTLGFTLSTVWRELRPPFLVSKDARHAAWSPVREVAAAAYRTVFRPFFIDAGTLQNILSRCRKHKTTLTGLLHALPLASLSQQLSPEEADTLYSITALDLRRFMPLKPKGYPHYEPANTMDNEMTLQDHYFDGKLLADIRSKSQGLVSETEVLAALEDTLWSVAARTREEIQAKLDGDATNDLLGLMKFVGDWRPEFRKKLRKPRVGAWGVSNLGAIDGGTGGWRMERAAFQLSAEVGAPVFHISAISVKGRELCVDVSWMEGTVEEGIGEKLARDMETWMRCLGARGETQHVDG